MIKRILLLGAFALALGAVARITTAPSPAVAVPEAAGAQAEWQGDGRPRWRELWTRPAPALAAMDVADSGGAVAWVDRDGGIRRMDGQGRTLWQTAPLSGINRVEIAADGTILAYAWLNPNRSSVTVLPESGGGKRRAAFALEGAIWDAALSPDGSRAVVGTGARYAYVLPLTFPADTAPVPLARWRTPGIPESVTVSTGEPLAILGTWQEAGVSAFGLDGTFRWQHYEPESARLFTVRISHDGGTAVGVSAKGPAQGDARLHVWDTATWRLLWSEDLEAFRPRALTTRDGRFIAVTYLKTLTYRTGEVRERKLALYDRKGKRLWEKGGLFFSPERLVALSADGARLTVTDGGSTFYTLDNRGHFVSKLRLPVNPRTGVPPTIREVVATQDGAFLLVRRSDGQISLLKATS